MDKEEEKSFSNDMNKKKACHFSKCLKTLMYITVIHTDLEVKSVFVMHFGEGLDCFDEVN